MSELSTRLQSASNNDLIADELAQRNISIAKDYVLSLNLDDKGKKHIEEACLSQLDEFMEDKDGILTSYTVLVPKAQSRSMKYYGSKDNVDFYYDWYSSYTREFKKTLSGATNLKHWADGGTNIVMCFVNAKVTVPWTIFQSIMGAPKKYGISNSAYVENCFNLKARCRGLYATKDNGLKLIFSSETGEVAPFSIFHPVDTKYRGSYNYEGPKKSVWTKDFNNKSRQLTMAANWYHHGYYSDLYQRLTEVAPKFVWGK